MDFIENQTIAILTSKTKALAMAYIKSIGFSRSKAAP